MRVAIVGTGIAGLTAGWLLNRAGHDVTLLERMTNIGLDAHSADWNSGSTNVPNTLRLDVPPRMFNPSLWPQLSKLYEAIGVEKELVDPSKSFGILGGSTTLTLGDSFFMGLPIRQLLSRDARSIAADIQRMQNSVDSDLNSPDIEALDFDAYLDTKRYSDAFIYQFLFPALASTVCTCSYESLRSYPAKTILTAMASLVSQTGLYRVLHGSRSVGNQMLSGISDVRVETEVESAMASDDSVVVRLATGETLTCEHLIVATQANSAKSFLPGLSESERYMLDMFDYESIEVILHQDETLMPKSRSDWSNFNMLIGQGDAANTSAMCTVWMNKFSPNLDFESDLFQTICPITAPDPSLTICTRVLQRPVVNRRSLEGWKRLTKLHRVPGRRVWFTGSYASEGVPLLESGVVSSMNVVQAMGFSTGGEFITPMAETQT